MPGALEKSPDGVCSLPVTEGTDAKAVGKPHAPAGGSGPWHPNGGPVRWAVHPARPRGPSPLPHYPTTNRLHKQKHIFALNTEQ